MTPNSPGLYRGSRIAVAAMLLMVAGCATSTQTTLIDTRADRSAVGAGLDMRDFEHAAGEAVASMLASPAIVKPTGDRYVLAISRMTNDTMQRIDTDMLVKKIRIDLLNSGRFLVSTTIGFNGVEDPMALKMRELRGSHEFNQAHVNKVAGAGQMIAPELSLSGKIIQLNQRLGDGSQRIDYAFQLTLSDIRTGLGIWEGETPISKLTSGKTVAW
jgi:uncharacterized protein (TIGR02722 family)